MVTAREERALFPVEADGLTDLLADVAAPDAPEGSTPEGDPDAEPVTEDEDETGAADEQPADDDEEQPASEAPAEEPPPVEDEGKRGLRRAVFRTVDRYLAAQTEEERKAILERASADERQQLKWLAERQAQRRQPAEASVDDPARWTPFEEMERLAVDDPYTFGEKVRPGGEWAKRYQAWLGFVADLDQKGFHLGDNPPVAAVRAAVRQHNAMVEAQERRQREQVFDPEAAYDAFAASPVWAQLTAEEKESADPANFSGDSAGRRLQMERHLGRLEERAARRAERDPLLKKVEQANGTAQKARALAENAPPKVEGGRVQTLTDDEIEERYIADPARYRKQYEALRARRGWK
jgi:hypothetical protein